MKNFSFFDFNLHMYDSQNLKKNNFYPNLMNRIYSEITVSDPYNTSKYKDKSIQFESSL